MRFSSNSCGDNFELALFVLTSAVALTLIISAPIVFLNESEEPKTKPNWKYFPLIWLWPLVPFFTSRYLNKVGRLARPFYLASFILVIVLTAAMYLRGYCIV